MAASPSFVKELVWKASISARLWMSSGCAFRERRAIRRLRSGAWTSADPRVAQPRHLLAVRSHHSQGAYDDLRARGLPAFQAQLAQLAPFLRDRVAEFTDWDQIKLLTVIVDRLKRWWRPGLLCIGDSAHAMSPIGGVGINLAIQDAVAAANILAKPLQTGPGQVTATLPRCKIGANSPHAPHSVCKFSFKTA